MMRLRRTLLILVSAFGLLGVGLVTAAPVYADASTDAAKASACAGLGGTFDPATSKCKTEGANLDSVIANIINLFSVLVGVVAVIMIMVGGFKFITAGGDSAKVTSAKSTLTYAIVGLVIVAFAQAIVKFVIKRAT